MFIYLYIVPVIFHMSISTFGEPNYTIFSTSSSFVVNSKLNFFTYEHLTKIFTCFPSIGLRNRDSNLIVSITIADTTILWSIVSIYTFSIIDTHFIFGISATFNWRISSTTKFGCYNIWQCQCSFWRRSSSWLTTNNNSVSRKNLIEFQNLSKIS